MAHSPLVFLFGVLGNIASFVCFLAPLPTFYRVCKKKTTEGFQSIPYVAALFSAMLWIFYAYVKTGETLLITINAFGCVIETIYLAIYVTYCPKKARMYTLRLILLLNFGGFCIIVLVTHLIAKGESSRIKLLGWICVVFSTSVFAAPLSIIRVVIRTKSVEFMPFPLSLLLTVSAVMWLLYGIALRDIYVTLPNIVGLSFGMVQMVLYAMYRKNKPMKDEKLPEHKGDINNTENKVEEEKQEKQVEVVSVEIGEKKEDNKKQEEEEEEQAQLEKKKQFQGDSNELQTEHKKSTNNNTREAIIDQVV
ncbi:bidirectional sugar transporter SWEET12-like [Senna tora]|uniref:Bidirectional sugar transporter SWEET n=1 Tax=Senna tora TaxID=362788 RepID=A0A834X8Q2_9FABA|nr:bidirectional sugar transporter SWEET12-like [Senna tora]